LSGAGIDAAQFRQALGAFATGVTIVTTRDESGQDVGLTANSFNSVSLNPPLVLWSLSRKARSHPAFARCENFAVHILAADQEALSARFATAGADKFEGLRLTRGAGGVPLLDSCAARFVCRTSYRYEGGDHEIFVGEVLEFEHFPKPPLVYQRGQYAVAVSRPRVPPLAQNEATAEFGKDFLVYLVGLANALHMRRILPVIAEHGLDDSEYFVLAALIMEDGRSSTELDALLQITNRRLTSDLLAALVRKDLVREEAGSLHLTGLGRKTALEVLSLSKLVEDDATRQIDQAEVALLKQLLRQMIRTSLAELPGLTSGRG
jgi:3-hydroxy-9,10-secoandrosta-1,3,5(10)-triene-9,17-dione monooxygenase reductase component